MKYYSFKLGFDDQKPRNWLHQDYKIAAPDIRTAIIVHYWINQRAMNEYMKNKFWNKQKEFHLPLKSYVQLYYRQVIEYEKVFGNFNGYTINQFKRIKIYNPKHYAKYFNNDIR